VVLSAAVNVTVTGRLPTASAPLPAEESPSTAGFEASTVNPVDAAAGVAAVVVRVSVEVFDVSAARKLTVLGLNDAVTPVGRVVVRLKSAEKAVPVAPLRFTITVYAALPAAP
jgi:FlaG/FlaF family flagellin (archaellin)